MAVGKSELQILINAKDNASGALGNLRKGLNLVGVAAVAAAGASVKLAADFDKGMREVATLTPDVAENLDAIKTDVLDLSKTLGIDAVEATGALYQAISAGVPTDNAISFLEIASKAAIGGVTDTETAVDGLTTVMNAFASQNIDAQDAADVMFATVKAGKTTFDELSDSLFQVAPLADAAGVSFAEISAALATLTAQGTPTRVATTQLRAAIQALTRPSEELTAIFKDAGIESGELAVRQLGLAGAADIVSKATGGSISTMTKLLGSIEGVQGLLGITGASAEMFAKNVQGMADAGGAAEAAFQEMEKSTSRQFEKMTNKTKAMAIELGTKLLPVINKLLVFLNNMHPTFEKVALAIAGTTAALGLMSVVLPPVITSVKLLNVALTALYRKAAPMVVAAIAAITPAIAAVIAVVAVLAVGIGILGVKFGWFNGIGDAFGKLWGGVTEKVQEFVNALGFGAIAMDDTRDALAKLTLDQRDQLRITEDLEGATSSYTATLRINSNQLEDMSDTIQTVRLRAIEPMGDSVGMLENGYLTLTDRMFMAEKQAKRLAEAEERLLRKQRELNNSVRDSLRWLQQSNIRVGGVADAMKILSDRVVPKVEDRLEALRANLVRLGTASADVERIIKDVRFEIAHLEGELHDGAAAVNQMENAEGDFIYAVAQADAAIKNKARSVGGLTDAERKLRDVQVQLEDALRRSGLEADELKSAYETLASLGVRPVKTGYDALIDAVKDWGDANETNVDKIISDLDRARNAAIKAAEPIVLATVGEVRAAQVKGLGDVQVQAAKLTTSQLRDRAKAALRLRTKEHEEAGVDMAFINRHSLAARRLIDGMTDPLLRQFIAGAMQNISFGTGTPGNVAGFQRGGSFVVPGSGGPDSQRVSFFASPGERVSVSRPGQAAVPHQTIIVQGSVITERQLGTLAVNAMRKATRLNENVLRVSDVMT
jgi:TP901 family phage tail tape measure protein